MQLRRSEPVFHRREFLGEGHKGEEDVTWLDAGGTRMEGDDWSHHRVLGMLLDGGAIPTRTRRGRRVKGNSFLVYANLHHEAADVALPAEVDASWRVELMSDGSLAEGEQLEPGATFSMPDRCVLVLRREG